MDFFYVNIVVVVAAEAVAAAMAVLSIWFSFTSIVAIVCSIMTKTFACAKIKRTDTHSAHSE